MSMDKLTDYVFAMAESRVNDSNAKDHSLLKKHLTASAEMYSLLHKAKADTHLYTSVDIHFLKIINKTESLI